MSKAATRGEKLRRRRGRPKLEAVAREPNGRISRSGIDHAPADELALAIRAFHLGLTMEQAKDQKAETFIGAMVIRGQLSEERYRAIVAFQDIRDDYLRSILAPDATRDNKQRGGSGDQVSDAYVQWCEAAKKRYDGARKAVQRDSETSRRALWPAFHICVLQNKADHSFVNSLIAFADSLIAHFGKTERANVDRAVA